MLVEGSFPLPEEPFHQPPRPAPGTTPGMGPPEDPEQPDEPTPEELAERARRAALPAGEGRLVFLTSSELFNDQRFYHEDFRADHLLLNAVAELCLPPELARIATRRPVARGFDFVEPEAKKRWRTAVLAAGPLVLLLFGLARGLRRLRPSPYRSHPAA